jgi:hypothetical protein
MIMILVMLIMNTAAFMIGIAATIAFTIVVDALIMIIVAVTVEAAGKITARKMLFKLAGLVSIELALFVIGSVSFAITARTSITR